MAHDEVKGEQVLQIKETTAEPDGASRHLRIDTAERKLVEFSLLNSDTVLRKILEAIPDLLAVIDRDLRIVYSNWRGGYEYISKETRCRSPFCYEAFHPEQNKHCEPCHALEVFRTGKPLLTEKYNPRVGNIEIRAYPIFDETGEVIMVTEHIRDITERKRSAEELKKHRLFLEQLVAERTAELEAANVQLRREINERKRAEAEIRRMNDELEQTVAERTCQLVDAKEELLRKEKLAMLGRLAGSVGHELRNPLGVMNNAVYFLKTIITDPDPTVREYLDIIKYEIDNSQKIITDLNDLFRSKPPHTMLTTIVELVRQSIEKCKIPENVWLLTEIPTTLPPLTVDPKQISLVFQHLITNSIQAMPEGGTLIINGREDPESGTLKTSFIDTGDGISPENMKKLFQPLFTTKERGVGLGLTICRNLTEANGGRIEVESRQGEGTTFTVLLPVAMEEDEDAGSSRGNISG
jgi:signal transduction histidine kinase